MIPTSRLAAASALLIALGAHGATLLSRAAPQDVQIEGGAPAGDTALGNSFSDMVAGTNKPVSADVSTAETPPDAAQKPEPKEVTPNEQPQKLEKVSPQTAQPATPAATNPATTPPVAQTSTSPVQIPTAQAEPLTDTAVQGTTALTYNEPQAIATTRPVARTATKPDQQVPDQATEPTTSPTKPEKPTKPVKPVEKQKPKPKPAPSAQGNSDTNAKRGTSTGTQPKAKVNSGTTNTRSSNPGNAALTNYKGQVLRKIRRKKKRTTVKGTVLVSFGISASGALTRVSVSRSSGSAQLDQLAVQQIRRAAPFAPPPGGAPIGFSVKLENK